MRHVVMKFILIIFDRFQQCEFCVGMLGKAARVKEPAFPFCLAFDHPFSQKLAMTAAFADASAQACDTKGIALARNRANKGHAVWCVSDGAIDNSMDACLGQGWQTLKDTFHIIKASVQIIRAERHCEIRVNAIHAKRFTFLLINTDKKALFLLARIEIITWIADNWHTLFHLF